MARRVPVFLDTYGPALKAIWGFWPTAIQLNRREAALHLRKAEASDGDVAGLLEEWAPAWSRLRRSSRMGPIPC